VSDLRFHVFYRIALWAFFDMILSTAIGDGGARMSWFDKLRVKKSLLEQPDRKDNTRSNQIRLSTLTTSELKVFMLLREGFTNKECSERLNLKRSEVKKITKNIFRKLDVKSTAELIVKYHEYN